MKILRGKSIKELGRMIRTEGLKCEELTEAILFDIKSRNNHLKAFVRTTDERAIEESRFAQRELDNGIDRGPLHGIPYAIKDLFDVAGEPNSAGTPLLENNIATKDAEVVSRMKYSGAVLVGQTNTSPLGATILGINHAFGTPHNPWKKEAFIPGGSSSGSAVAVASGLVPLALGTDTGGSIRVPAAMCGIVGLKTTVGKINVDGMRPLAPTYDSIGSLTRSVNDALLVYEALHDEPMDCSKRLENLKIGLCENIFFDEIEIEVKKAVLDAANILAELGTEICSLKLQEVDNIYDQIKETSLIASEAYPLHKKIIENSSIDWVTNWLKVASNYSVEQVVNSQKKIKELSFQLNNRTKNLDAIIVPTTPIVAKLVSSCDSYMSHASISSLISRNTYIGNLVGWCGIALPCGINKKGLPISLLIYSGANNEHTAFRIAKAFEEVLFREIGSLKSPFFYN